MAKPGTNPWIRQLFDDTYNFVETDQQVVHFAGVLRDDGIVASNTFDLLLWKPGRIHVEFFRRLLQGVTHARLSPTPEIITRADADLHRRGVYLDMPLVLLHVRPAIIWLILCTIGTARRPRRFTDKRCRNC